MAHIGTGQSGDIQITNSNSRDAWESPGRLAVSAVYAKAQDHDLVPQDAHKIVHGSFSVPAGTSLTISTGAKLVILDG